MSPLTDVTNTAGYEALLETQCRGFQRSRTKRISRSCPRIPCPDGQGEVNEVEFNRNFKDSKPEAIKMCNIRLSEKDGNNVCQSDCQCSDPRIQHDVPSLPQTADILLSQAVRTLNLSQKSANPGLQSQNHVVQPRKKGKKITGNKLSGRREKAQCSGLPETPGSEPSSTTPQQCGACGLEFTSLPALTQHLARHVYDGLYAAQWLTQAMQLLVPRQPSSTPSQDDRDSTSDILQTSPVD